MVTHERLPYKRLIPVEAPPVRRHEVPESLPSTGVFITELEQFGDIPRMARDLDREPRLIGEFNLPLILVAKGCRHQEVQTTILFLIGFLTILRIAHEQPRVADRMPVCPHVSANMLPFTVR